MPPATHVRTDTIPLGQLQHFPGNARRGDAELILSSLRRNGQYRGLVVRHVQPDGPLIVLAGNHTMEGLQLHGPGPCDYRAKVNGEDQPCGICRSGPWEPAARCDLIICDDDTARRINLVDNRSAEKGSYDRDALAELLSYMGDDLDGTGYNQADIELLIAPPPSPDELADTYGDPEEDDFWPVLKFRVAPEVRDAFYGLTINCPNPNDDSERFRYLLDRAREATDPAA